MKKQLILSSFLQGVFFGPAQQLLHLIYFISPFFIFALIPRLLDPLLAGIIPLFFWGRVGLGGGAGDKLGKQKNSSVVPETAIERRAE